MLELTPVLVLTIIFGTILAIVYLGIRRKERMAMMEKEPRMTRFLALQLARSHYFNHTRACSDFGYKPLISIEEGTKRLLESLKR